MRYLWLFLVLLLIMYPLFLCSYHLCAAKLNKTFLAHLRRQIHKLFDKIPQPEKHKTSMFQANMFVNFTVYVKNKCPSRALKNQNAFEMWYGHIPLVGNLRVFGFTCYALIPKEKRNKFVQGVESASSWGTQIPPGISSLRRGK
jgi:hypothetical protein